MYLLTLILGTVLLPEASTLNCYECIPGGTGPDLTCNDTTQQCPSHCAVLRTVTYAGGSKQVDVTAKSCVWSELCGEYSVDYGVYRTVVTSKCCTSDLCNTQPVPEPSKTNPNGKKCFSCNGQTCTSTLNCQGNEDHCISATGILGGQEVTWKGCANKAVCSFAQSALFTAAPGTKISCCQGDYCNSASSTSAGLLLLVTPLISLILN